MNAIKMFNDKIDMDHVINNFLELYLELKNTNVELKNLFVLLGFSIAVLSLIYIT